MAAYAAKLHMDRFAAANLYFAADRLEHILNRQEALALMEEHLASPHLRKHSLASEAVMKALARHFNEDEHEWGLLGLLHDLDYEQTQTEPAKHGLVTTEILAGRGLSQAGLQAIAAHNAEELNLTRQSLLDKALTAAEVVTGMIVAAALVQPDKKIASVRPESVVKRMKEKSFARGANRDHIRLCEEIGLPLPQFITLAVAAMGEIGPELGL